MPRYNVDINLKGTFSDDGMEIESFEQVKAEEQQWRITKLFRWFFGLDLKAKLVILVILGLMGYAIYSAIQARDYHVLYTSLQPITDRVIEIVKGFLQ